MTKLWNKSNKGKSSNLAAEAEAFTVGEDPVLDQRLLPYDVQASKVHAEGLMRMGLLNEQECDNLHAALDEIHERWKDGEFEISRSDEDMHTAIESYLTEKLGATGKKIHAGRSRNDQVLTAMRLFERDYLQRIWNRTIQTAQDFLEFAGNHRKVPMPGYTHTQPAMLSSVGLWSAAFAERLVMNLEYLPGLYRNINRCPLGTAAGFGVNFDLPRDFVAEKLGFEGPIIASMTAQHTRGRVELELLSGIRPISDTLSHFANDLIWYTSREFDFFDVDEDLCTGSSIMPQKKNLDTAEILRGRHAELEGALSQLKAVIRNLTSGYHRDLQLTKAPIIRGCDVLFEMLGMTRLLVQNMEPKTDSLKKACTPEIFAADQVNEYVKKGETFRDAYKKVGRNLDSLKQIDPVSNLKSKNHLGAPGQPGIERIRERLKDLSLRN